MFEAAGITITERDDRVSTAGGETVLARLQQIENPTTGIITGLRRVPVPPGEPAIENYVVDREDFTPFTDGEAMAHEEGGCAFTEEDALIAAYGEAIERYCGCVFRQEAFRTASYSDLAEPAIDPTAVVNFSLQQQESMDEAGSLCGVDDQLSWVVGKNLDSGAETYVPAQLVYLSYPPTAEPFIRNPISTGLATGSSRNMAIHNGLSELVERDAFMTYYLTKTALPIIDPTTAPPRIQRLVDRVTGHGLELTLLDGTTDLGVPVAIAVLVDRESSPAITVAAAGGSDATDVIESALEEVVQTRLWTISLLEDTDRSPEDLALEGINSYAERGLLWSVQNRISDLEFWIESNRGTTVDEFEADLTGSEIVDRVTAAGYDCYAVDVTTREISKLGFSVQRVIAPRLQPLYLLERLRYFGGDRLSEVPVDMGYRETPLPEAMLNTVPHPFP
jgi:ribosomal protein S12 methylthiotransferase accessory factor